MKLIWNKIKNLKILNTGFIKKIKNKLYKKFVSDRMESRTNKYRKELLILISKICSDTRWLINCGSFLRFYRDKTMDNQDIDLFIIREDFDKIKNNFIKEGFIIKQKFYNNENKIVEYKLLYKDVDIDVFMIDKDSKGYYVSSTFDDAENLDKIERKVSKKSLIVTGLGFATFKRYMPDFEIKEYTYENIKFNGPKNAEKHLEAFYGKWQVYDPKYDFRYAPKNNLPIKTPNAKGILYYESITKF